MKDETQYFILPNNIDFCLNHFETTSLIYWSNKSTRKYLALNAVKHIERQVDSEHIRY